MKETEITVQVFGSLDKIKTILKNKGFELIETYQLNDWYFSKLDDISDVKYLDLLNNSFLVRQVVSDHEEVQLCYKKKEVDQYMNVVSEEKIKAKVNSLKNAIDIFVASGLNNYCVVKNNSYVYKKGETCFAVQVIEGLGTFIEYEENESMSGLTKEEKFDLMSRFVRTLGLKLGDDYSCKKVFMLLHKDK